MGSCSRVPSLRNPFQIVAFVLGQERPHALGHQFPRQRARLVPGPLQPAEREEVEAVAGIGLGDGAHTEQPGETLIAATALQDFQAEIRRWSFDEGLGDSVGEKARHAKGDQPRRDARSPLGGGRLLDALTRQPFGGQEVVQQRRGLCQSNGRSSARGATRPPSSDVQAARARHSAKAVERLCL